MTRSRPITFIFLLLYLPSASAKEILSFDQFLRMALEQNLDLKVETSKTEAARSNAKSLNIPPPMVGYMRMTDQSGSSANGIEVTQMIPFPTKVTKDKSARNLEAQAQHEARSGAEADLRAKAKLLYVSLWIARERQDALEQKKKAIESHLRLARAGVRSDSFLRIHLLKAESDLDLLENDLIAARQDVKEKEASAASFLNVDPGQFHPEIETPSLTQIPEEKLLTSPHQLESARLTVESFKARESLGKSSWFPDLNLRYKEIGQTQMMPQTSEIMIGITLPFVFPWDTSASSSKASAERLQAEFGYEQTKRKIETERTVLTTKATALKTQLDNINQKLLPRVEKRIKLLHNLAPRDMETLQDHRDAMEAFPELKLKALDLRERYEETVAELLRYTRGAPQ